MSGVYIFVGPSIQIDELSRHVDATFLSPVSQGDVLGVLRYEPDLIGIIDGYFERIPSVWHKEILQALSQGVRVVGASSMGALRAAELHPFGMEGVGQVFEWYRDGVITSDDEVAIRHASMEFDFRPLSEAMVNIRATLELAVKKGVLSDSDFVRWIALARSIPYWDRSYPVLFEKALSNQVPADDVDNLRRFVVHSRVDQKREDAIAMASYIQDTLKEKSPAPSFELNRTTRLQELDDRDIFLGIAGEARVTPDMVVEQARTQLGDFSKIYETATTHGLMLKLATLLGLCVNEKEFEQGLALFQKKNALESEEALNFWLNINHLTVTEFHQMVREFLLIAKLQQVYPPENRDILRQLRMEGKYAGLELSAA
jgi:hypothetical protein